ncbi:MAG: fibronectin type III domain-containing protein [Ruminococcaceae bacterium]|nr:fibronectin type III domain-containing protein [Oscillospiraceae bacterium]
MKKTFSILLSLIMIISVISALPFTAKAQVISGEADNVNYSLDTATGVMTISGSGAIMSNYNATNTPWNDYKSDIKKVVFENDIELIGENAFNGCTNLSEIVFSQNLTVIGASAFVGCTSLQSVEIPDSVSILNGSAFMKCTSLKNVKLSKNTTGINSFTFKNCTSLESISIPARVASIGNMAFQGCTNLKHIDFEKSEYMTIYEYAFDGCTSLREGGIFYNGTYEDWQKYVINSEGNGTFINAPIQFLETGKCGENVSYVFNPKTGELVISGKGDMYDNDPIYFSPFANKNNIKSVVIEEGVTSVGIMAFFQSSVETVSLPSTLTKISESAFYECTKLNNPVIPASVEEIGQSAFMGCSAITEITLPGAITSIESCAFSDCYSLTSVDIPAAVTIIKDGAFSGCEMLSSISLWYGVESIGRSAFFGCTSLSDVYYYGSGAQFRQINISASNECFENATTHYKNNVGQCGAQAYYSYDGNTKAVVISGSGDMFDYDSENNKSPFFISEDVYTVEVTNGVTSIGAYAFYNCTNITTVTLADSVETIGEHAFDYCYRMTSVNFGTGVSTIKESAFMGCTKLETVNYAGSDEDWNKVAILEENFSILDSKPQLISGICGLNATFTLDTTTGLLTISGTGKVYRDDMDAKHIRIKVKNIVIEEGITEIFVFVFKGMENLESVYLPNSLKEIDRVSFYGCSSDFTVSARCNNKAVKEAFADTNHQIIKRHRTDNKYTAENKKEATCTEDGYYELNMRCMDCGVIVDSKPHTDKALGHKIVTTTTKASFDKDGQIVKKCSRCGKVTSKTTIFKVTATANKTKFAYNGKTQYPSILLMDTHKTGLFMSDYSYKWPSKSTNVGSYTVTITLKGDKYTGTKKLSYQIIPKGTSISSLTSPKAGRIKVKWKQQKTQTTGYSVQYATDSNFTKNVKTVSNSNNNSTNTTFTGLKKNTKYYVRVRTYKTVNGARIYSNWSSVKSVTTKK